jgi:hypothetical protein
MSLALLRSSRVRLLGTVLPCSLIVWAIGALTARS